MDKRYQVFISSTYEDLIDERQRVLKVLPELKCIPIGMELFPASDKKSWDYIKKVINNCDYCIVISAGKYGTIIDGEQISFTEKEYDYAIEKDIPVLPFIHEDIGSISSSKVDSDSAIRDKLNNFHKKLNSNHLCNFFQNKDDLVLKVSMSILQLSEENPAAGWIRTSDADEIYAQDKVKLLDQIEFLKKKLQSDATQPPPGSEEFAQGDDIFEIKNIPVELFSRDDLPDSDSIEDIDQPKPVDSNKVTIKLTWDEIIKNILPKLMFKQDNYQFGQIIKDFLYTRIDDKAYGSFFGKYLEDKRYYTISSCINEEYINIIKYQLLVLGCIKYVKSSVPALLDLEDLYWQITQYGEFKLMSAFAIRKNKRNL